MINSNSISEMFPQFQQKSFIYVTHCIEIKGIQWENKWHDSIHGYSRIRNTNHTFSLSGHYFDKYISGIHLVVFVFVFPLIRLISYSP